MRSRTLSLTLAVIVGVTTVIPIPFLDLSVCLAILYALWPMLWKRDFLIVAAIAFINEIPKLPAFGVLMTTANDFVIVNSLNPIVQWAEALFFGLALFYLTSYRVGRVLRKRIAVIQ